MSTELGSLDNELFFLLHELDIIENFLKKVCELLCIKKKSYKKKYIKKKCEKLIFITNRPDWSTRSATSIFF
jgi:hypothetical protein